MLLEKLWATAPEGMFQPDLLMQKVGTDRVELHYFHLIVYSLIGSDEVEFAAVGLLSHVCCYPFSDMK